MVARSDIGGIRTRFPFRLHRLRWLVSAGLVASALAPAQVALAAPAAHQVTVQVIDRLGKPVTGTDESPQRVVFAELAGARKTFEVKPINGVARISLPAGAYGVVTEIVTPRPGDPHSAESQAFAAVARLVVDRDRALTLDARQGKRLGFAVDRPDAVLHAVTINVVLGGWHNHFVGFRTEHNAPVYLVPAPAANPADLTLGVLGVLAPTAHATMADTYQYSLARITTGIPADATFRFNDDELATHRVHYGAGGLPTKGEAGFESSYLPGEDPQGWWLETPLPASRTHMLTSGRWKGGMFERPAHELDPGEIAQFVIGSERTYRAGEASEERWNQAVFSPALQTPVSSGVTRAGNTLSVAVDMLAPGFGDYGSQVPFGSDVLSGSTTLSRGGTVIGRTEQAGSGTFTVPASTEKYTLAVQSRRLNPDTPLASKTDARWTFRSGRSGSGTTVLPLLSVRPSGPFDPLNRAPAGEPFPLTLDVAHQKGSTAPAITSVRLEVSFDDGRTWQSTGVTPGGMQTWRAMVTHPHRTATSGFVALRANAADDAGGTAQVTLLRAYKLA